MQGTEEQNNIQATELSSDVAEGALLMGRSFLTFAYQNGAEARYVSYGYDFRHPWHRWNDADT